ncbi:MAG TPA: hypothetical protein EYP56_10020 [Planctomycetaceae bacterium]|nr:hypothetical protein [Planctomycetaceae bacterium]
MTSNGYASSLGRRTPKPPADRETKAMNPVIRTTQLTACEPRKQCWPMLWPVLCVALLAAVQREAGGAAAVHRPHHPWLFLTAADVQRVHQAVRTNAQFARWAEELVARAESADEAELPSLDRAWWDAERGKPWRDTYPAVFQHTWLDPYAWADLARTCAYANMLRPSPGLVEKAKRLLLELADFTFEFEHYDVGLNYTVWGVVALEAYDILHESFDKAERRRLDAFFERFYRAVKKNDDYWVEHEPGGTLNNHYAWHKLCFVATGLFFARPERIDEAFEGPRGINFLMRYGFSDNGLWREGAIPYQFAATSPLLLAAELLENAGHRRSLYRGGETFDGRNLRLAYDALLGLLFPDRRLPTIGDCYGRRPHLGEHADFETLCRRFKDPRYAWLLRDAPRRCDDLLFRGSADLPQGTPPEQRCRLWPEAGYVALRAVEGTDYWSGRGWTLFATYSANRVHSNADKLSIQLFADGHLWLPDLEARSSEVHAFSSRVQARLNRHTICHNTLLVDRRNQRHPRRRLDLVEYHVLPGLKRVTIGDLSGQLYPHVRQLRTCIVREGYVLDVFQANRIRSHGTPSRLAWLLHIDGTPGNSSMPPGRGFDLPAADPWSYLIRPTKADLPGRYWEVLCHGRQHFRLDVATSDPGELIRCGFPLDDSDSPDVVPMRMFCLDTSEGWFAAVYQCGPEPPPAARIRLSAGELGNWLVTVEIDGQRFAHRVPQLSELPEPVR